MIDRKRHEEVFRAAMSAKKRLQEIVIARDDFSESEVRQLRETYFSNLDEYKAINRQWQAEIDAKNQRIQAIRNARRIEAQKLTKSELAAIVGVDAKRRTREDLIDLYATMKG